MKQQMQISHLKSTTLIPHEMQLSCASTAKLLKGGSTSWLGGCSETAQTTPSNKLTTMYLIDLGELIHLYSKTEMLLLLFKLDVLTKLDAFTCASSEQMGVISGSV